MKNFYKNLPVLVTGGAGFIGSHLVQKLVALQADVTVLDNLATGFSKNLKDVQEQIQFINGNITNKQVCIQATQHKKIVFHLAAFISVPESVEDPQTCHDVNVNGTFNLLQACHLNGVNRFVFSSSAAVYGPCETHCTETMPCNPTSPYGTSKLIGELLCQQYAQNYNLKTICLRYFNVFGENQNPQGAYAAVIAKFQNLMKQNKPITIFGDGLQTRDFIPVQDVVDANLILGVQDKKIMDGSPINIATGCSTTLLAMVEQLKKRFPNYNGNIVFKPARKGDIKYSCADAQKWQKVFTNSQECLIWDAKHPLDDNPLFICQTNQEW